MSAITPEVSAMRLYTGAVAALLAGVALFVLLPPKHILPTLCFYASVALATLSNISMARAGKVGRSSPYIFVAISLTVVGFIPMLVIMGYNLAKKEKIERSK